MAIELELEVPIGRSPEEVFAHLADIERWPEWLIASGIVRVERLDGPAPGAPLGPGSHLRIEQRAAGMEATLDARLTRFEPPHRLAVSGRDKQGIGVDIEAVLEPGGAGTRLLWRVRIGLPLRFRVFEGMAAPQVRRAAALDLEALRIRLESVASA